IVADEAPIQELLKHGGEHFPLVDVKPVAKKSKDNTEIVAAVRDSKWIGAETIKAPPQDIELIFLPDGSAKLSVNTSTTAGNYVINDATLTATFGPMQYVGEVKSLASGYEITGAATQKDANQKETKWRFNAAKIGAADTISPKKEKATF